MERIHAPAAAYYPMEEILGDEYFLSPIPPDGVSISVMGPDKVVCVFAMAVHRYQSGVAERINAHTDLRLISAIRYKGNNDLKG